MKWSLKLGSVAGIKIQVHWTFLILIGWVIISESRQGADYVQIILMIALLLAVFACVALHELGHALTARHFGITTRDITMLPIGGLARLEKMPEDPKQELLIAIGGPVVNVIIAAIILLILGLAGKINNEMLERMNSSEITALTFPFLLASVNIMLFVFNLIPAFPMDGGRIFRALLAFRIDRVKATRIAASLGQFIAILFAFTGLFFNPFLILIGIFVYLGAQFESQMVQSQSVLSHYKVKDVMMHKSPLLKANDPLSDAVRELLDGQATEFLVEKDGKIVGLLTKRQIIEGLASHKNDVVISEVMNRQFEFLTPDMPLNDVYAKMQGNKYSILPVIDASGNLLGSIDQDNIMEFIMIQSAINSPRSPL